MAVTISDNYQVKYTNKWGVLLQQKVSALEKLVTVDRDCKGEVKRVTRTGCLILRRRRRAWGAPRLMRLLR